MFIKLLTSARTWMLVFASLTLVAAASCTNDGTPNGPSDVPTPQTSGPTPPDTNATGNVNMEIRPNPVPFSGTPITDVASCASSANTWFYEQVFTETAGVEVHFTARTDTFDGRVTNSGAADITVPARGSITIRSRWCSVSPVSHTARSTFTGTDANGHSITASGGDVQLLSQ